MKRRRLNWAEFPQYLNLAENCDKKDKETMREEEERECGGEREEEVKRKKGQL